MVNQPTNSPELSPLIDTDFMAFRKQKLKTGLKRNGLEELDRYLSVVEEDVVEDVVSWWGVCCPARSYRDDYLTCIEFFSFRVTRIPILS